MNPPVGLPPVRTSSICSTFIRGLTEAGHTVIAIEHAQDFVNAADYVVELSR
jgi:hypothetical protein